MIFWAFLVVIGAIYFSNMFLGQYSLVPLLGLEIPKEGFIKKFFFLKDQNAKAQKNNFK